MAQQTRNTCYTCYKCENERARKERLENIPCRCKQQSVRIPCRCNERLERIPCRCKVQSVRLSCECPQLQLPIETNTNQDDMKSEPGPNTQPGNISVMKPKLPKKKSEWVFWKRVICEDGKERLLKTSQCPVPKSILRVDRSGNKYNYNHEDFDLIESVPKKVESLARENITGSIQNQQNLSKSERPGSISRTDKTDGKNKRNSKDIEKNKSERPGSISKGNKKDEQKQKSDKRNSKDVEKNNRESMTYEESDENETRNQNRRRRQWDAPNPFRIVPCQCAGPINRNTCYCR